MKTITKSVLLALTILSTNAIQYASAAPVLEARHPKNLWLKISADTNGLFTMQGSLKNQMVFDRHTNTSADHVFDTQGSIIDNQIDTALKIPGISTSLPYVDFADLTAKLNQLAADEASIANAYNSINFTSFYTESSFDAQLDNGSALQQFLSSAGDPKEKANQLHAGDPSYALAIYLRSAAAEISNPIIPATIDSTNIQQVKEIIKKSYAWKWTIDPAGKAALIDLKTKVAKYLNDEKIQSGWVSIAYNTSVNGQAFVTSSFLDLSRSDYAKLSAGTDTINFVGFNVITPTGLAPVTVPLTNSIEATYVVASQYPDLTKDPVNSAFLGFDSMANIQAHGYGIINYLVKDQGGSVVNSGSINVNGVYDDPFSMDGAEYTINNRLPEKDSTGIKCLINKYQVNGSGAYICRSKSFKDIKGLMAENSAGTASVKYVGRFELEHDTSSTLDGMPQGTFQVLSRTVKYNQCQDFTLETSLQASYKVRQLTSTYNVTYNGTNISFAYSPVNPQQWTMTNIDLPNPVTYKKTATFPRYMSPSDPADYETLAENYYIVDPTMSSGNIYSNSNINIPLPTGVPGNNYLIDTSDSDASAWIGKLSTGLEPDIHPNLPAGSLGKSRDYTSSCMSSIIQYPIPSNTENGPFYGWSNPGSVNGPVGSFTIGSGYAFQISGAINCTKQVYVISNIINHPFVPAVPAVAACSTCTPATLGSPGSPAVSAYDQAIFGLADTINYSACRETCPFGGVNTALTHPCNP